MKVNLLLWRYTGLVFSLEAGIQSKILEGVEVSGGVYFGRSVRLWNKHDWCVVLRLRRFPRRGSVPLYRFLEMVLRRLGCLEGHVQQSVEPQVL